MSNTIDKNTWRIIELIIVNYETYKKRLSDFEDEVILSSGSPAANIKNYDEDYTKPQSITELKALKLNNKYYGNLKTKINAIEKSYNMLRQEEQKVISERFWKYGKRTPYIKLIDVSYSETQMKRIVKKMIILVAKELGEIQ